MSTASVQRLRAERTRKRVRLAPVLDLTLFVPAVWLLVSGSYTSTYPSVTGLLALALVSLSLVRWGLTRRTPLDLAEWSDFLGGLAILTAVYIVVEQASTFGLDLFPLVLAVLALVVAFNSRSAGFGLTLIAIGIEVLICSFTSHQLSGRSWQLALTHSLWLSLFASLYGVFGLLTQRKRPKLLEPGIQKAARPQTTREPNINMLSHTLQLLARACQTSSCALLEFNSADHETMVVTASTRPVQLDVEVQSKVGIPASVARSKQAIMLNGSRPGFPGTLPEYGEHHPANIIAAPIMKSDDLQGILQLQRIRNQSFEQHHLEMARLGAQIISNAIASEQAVARISDAHYELERFFEASRMLASSLAPDEVYQAAHAALRMITPFDLMAITWLFEPMDQHRVVHTAGMWERALVGELVDSDLSLANMVLKNGHYLPIGCEYRPGSIPVLIEDEGSVPARSLIVLPLRQHDNVTGTLTIASQKAEIFSDEKIGMIEVIANQIAVSLANAKVYARVEMMATTDALTGLFNRRAFEQRLQEARARALRTNNPLALVVLDIDHFKSINDTYGHAIGDIVLSRLGATMKNLFRRTDTVARYGGEEFVLILEDTNLQGAFVMAERLRIMASELLFEGTAGKTFRITISLGVSCFPEQTMEPRNLFEMADKALYKCKEGGRNQTQVAQCELEPPLDRCHPKAPTRQPACSA